MMQVYYRQLMIEDKSRLLELLERVPPTITRMSNQLVYKAIMDDASRSRNAVIFVASLDNNLVGYTIAARDGNNFKCMFVLRHPFLGLVAPAKRMKEKLKTDDAAAHNLGRGNVVTLQPARNTNQTHAWEDSAKTIAKIIHMGIDPRVRSMGLGRGLYAHLITHFKQQGFTGIDAHIDKDNLAPPNMFKKAGWTVIHNASGNICIFRI